MLKLRAKINKVVLGENASNDYKQLRCWFYKRKALGHPPTALAEAVAAGDVKTLSDMSELSSDGSGGEDTKVHSTSSWKSSTKPKVQGRIFSDKQLHVLQATYDLNPRPDPNVFYKIHACMHACI